MKLNKMPKEELETLSYSDLTEMILKEKKKAVNTPTLFKEICKIIICIKQSCYLRICFIFIKPI